MSDVESDVDQFDINESTDEEEVIEVEDIPSEDINVPQSSKYMNILLTNMKYPSKFVVHALIMSRVKALFANARPLCSNPPPVGSGDYNTIFLNMVKIAVDEVMENKSPMMFDNPITKTQWSANDLDKTLFKKIMDEAMALAAD